MDDLEQNIEALAEQFPYPPTPEIKLKLNTRQPFPTKRYALVTSFALIMLIVAFVSVPPLRAKVREWFGLGSVSIEVRDNTQLDLTLSASTDLTDFFERSTYLDAQNRVDFTLRQPQLLRTPDEIYTTLDDSHTIVMIWLSEQTDTSQTVDVALHQISAQTLVLKDITEANEVEFTSVNGDLALWIETPHTLQYDETIFLVEASTLIWEADGITYRLEMQRTMDEAITLAESVE